MELVLPASLAPEEIACAEKVAKELELLTELVSELCTSYTIWGRCSSYIGSCLLCYGSSTLALNRIKEEIYTSFTGQLHCGLC